MPLEKSGDVFAVPSGRCAIAKSGMEPDQVFEFFQCYSSSIPFGKRHPHFWFAYIKGNGKHSPRPEYSPNFTNRAVFVGLVFDYGEACYYISGVVTKRNLLCLSDYPFNVHAQVISQAFPPVDPLIIPLHQAHPRTQLRSK